MGDRAYEDAIDQCASHAGRLRIAADQQGDSVVIFLKRLLSTGRTLMPAC